ncbi:TRAP transporter small permease [Oceanibaculum pacificum]|uniref:TRAP transporter small permease protein n=1 Tax=Oceanibaculum pacificum TaxID=580166 RepID=A0A154W2K5_9PROT|nr:TRAP transporter small permease [Oceanibaculum pacificum]KZD07784.1 C4-dicarboxylate ABC transporter [Oceanibaculum pacificum]
MRRFYDLLCRVEAVVAGACLIAMVVLIFLGGIARLMREPMNWTIDFATCLFAWACFLCADIAWRKGGLMSIDLFTARLPEPAQRALLYCNYLIIAGFLVYLAGAGAWLSWISRSRSFQGIPEISYSWVTMSLPVGAVLLLITTALKFRQTLLDGRASSARIPG